MGQGNGFYAKLQKQHLNQSQSSTATGKECWSVVGEERQQLLGKRPKT